MRQGRARGCARVAWVALCALACSSRTPGAIGSPPLDPHTCGDVGEPIALAFFLSSDPEALLPQWLRALEPELAARGGERVYAGRIDPALAGTTLHTDVLVIDRYDSWCAGVEVLQTLAPPESLAREHSFVLVLRPWSRAAHVFSDALAAFMATLLAREVGDAPPLVETPRAVSGSREISPDPEALRRFADSAPSAPLAMLNLNEFRRRARYAPGSGQDPTVSGESAYWRYARIAVPQVMRRGGRLLFAGQPVGKPIGAAGALDRHWDQLALVYYPSLRALEDMVADIAYREGAVHRVAALAHATLLATTPWPEFDPRLAHTH